MNSGGPFVPSALRQAAGIPDAVCTGNQFHAGHFSTCKELLGKKTRREALSFCGAAHQSQEHTLRL